MALIKCPDCGSVVSDKADFCPICGRSVSSIINQPPTAADDRPQPASQSTADEPVSADIQTPQNPQIAGSIRPGKEKWKLYALIAGIAAAVAVVCGVIFIVKGHQRQEETSFEFSYSLTDGSAFYPESDDTPAAHPSSIAVSTEASFYCENIDTELKYENGYTPYSYEDYVILSGENYVIPSGNSGDTGIIAGYDVVSYNKTAGRYDYVYSAQEVIVYPPLVICIDREIIEKGRSEADTEYEYFYEYYSGTTVEKMYPTTYSGTLGKSRITMELALDSETPKGVGTYYYDRIGPGNRMIVYADILDDGSLELNSYDRHYYDSPSEKMVLRRTDSGYAGYWERPNRDRLDVELYER